MKGSDQTAQNVRSDLNFCCSEIIIPSVPFLHVTNRIIKEGNDGIEFTQRRHVSLEKETIISTEWRNF